MHDINDYNINWLSTRKRKLPGTANNISTTATAATGASIATAKSSPSPPVLPLDWTQLSACHIKKPRLQPGAGGAGSADRELEKVSGRGIFFLPSPNSDLDPDNSNDANDDTKDNLTWFQGRFFPSAHLPVHNNSPRSIVTHAHDSTPPFSYTSWGMMGIQKLVVDECLRCSEGGYRQVDLTFIRYLSASSYTRKKEVVRWKAEGLTWTGGDMMRLSTVPYATKLTKDETGVKFDPVTIVEGEKAMAMAEKYFPALVKQMRKEGEDDDDALIVIGNMDVVIPKSFVERSWMNNVKGDLLQDDDGLWSD